MDFIRGQNTSSFPRVFDFKIWFRARKVTRSFEKRAPGLDGTINVSQSEEITLILSNLTLRREAKLRISSRTKSSSILIIINAQRLFGVITVTFTSTQQPGPKTFYFFFKTASDQPFNYHSWLWLLLSPIILSQTWSKFQNWWPWR